MTWKSAHGTVESPFAAIRRLIATTLELWSKLFVKNLSRQNCHSPQQLSSRSPNTGQLQRWWSILRYRDRELFTILFCRICWRLVLDSCSHCFAIVSLSTWGLCRYRTCCLLFFARTWRKACLLSLLPSCCHRHIFGVSSLSSACPRRYSSYLWSSRSTQLWCAHISGQRGYFLLPMMHHLAGMIRRCLVSSICRLWLRSFLVCSIRSLQQVNRRYKWLVMKLICRQGRVEIKSAPWTWFWLQGLWA